MVGVIELGPEQMGGTTIQELAASTATETASVRGASFTNTAYGLLPVKYTEELIDAAKQEFFFANFVHEISLGQGESMVSIPKRNIYLGDDGMDWNTTGAESLGSGAGVGPYANTVADITFTNFDNLSSVDSRPLPHGSGFALRRWDLRTNVLNLVEAAREDLGYAMGARIDIAIAKKFGTADGLTFAQIGIRGATQLYGGDADADSALTTGDVITTDLLADGIRYLKGTENWVRADASGKRGAFTLDTTILQNGWQNTRDDPFVLFIGVAQEATLRKDSQFVNASEYGSDTVIQNGEIGRYLETRIIVTAHVESFALSTTGPDDSSTAGALAGGMTRCILMKGRKAAALVWGMRPEVRVMEWGISDQILIAVWSYYDIVVVHSDAVVCIDVSNT